jgi:secondary thiamine-phosphate synthase enzyme
MKVLGEEILLNTRSRKEIINLTPRVREVVKKGGIKDGVCLVFSTHSTTAVTINEDEEGLKADLLAKLEEDFPEERGWLHNRIDDNADAHLAGAVMGPSVLIPVTEGELRLGTWQSILFLELDGPRPRRKVLVQVIGE